MRKRQALTSQPSLRERLAALHYLVRLFREVWTTSPSLVSAALGLRLIAAFQAVATFYVGKLIVDEIVSLTPLTPSGPSLTEWLWNGKLNRLEFYVGLELGLTLFFDAVGRGVSIADGLLSEKHNNRISIALMVHAAGLDLQHFESSAHQDQIEIARDQAGWSSYFLVMAFGLCENLTTLATLLAGLFAYSPALIVVLAAALAPVLWNEAHFNALSYRINFDRAEERRQLDYLRQIGIHAGTAKEIKLFGLGGFLMSRFSSLADKFYGVNKRLAIERGLWTWFFFTLSTAGYYIAYAVIIWRTVSGIFSLGDLTFLTGAFLRLRQLVQTTLVSTAWISSRAIELQDLFGFFDIEPRIASPKVPTPFPEIKHRGIEFQNVGFRYPDSENWVVRDLSFTLHPSEAIALVGENGAGKTTIVKLMTRLYDPDEGRILVEGMDLKSFDLEELRRHIGVIFQDFIRYEMTAHENIAVGQIDFMGDDARVATAADQSLASSVIDALPLGYAQPLGKKFSQGRDLSGGEWQKIALARAYMRDAGCLILDEPTAAIDARAEAQVFERFKDICKGRSALLISHRFSTVRMADRILVLERGRIIEKGNHQELLRRQGRYAELFELQAQGYR
ncbi:MAG TPA: ABC transporter ATP-binding protein [Methylocella sp.]|nr:ABC transporter ATP-binding protein [Methylocella sp.]